MPVPDLLSKHIEYLQLQGYEIVVKENNQEIGIVIKNLRFQQNVQQYY